MSQEATTITENIFKPFAEMLEKAKIDYKQEDDQLVSRVDFRSDEGHNSHITLALEKNDEGIQGFVTGTSHDDKLWGCDPTEAVKAYISEKNFKDTLN